LDQDSWRLTVTYIFMIGWGPRGSDLRPIVSILGVNVLILIWVLSIGKKN
jgi:hypothetical protein